ncbi:ogr/Delta-like zinc finger family protein [Citrobacter portucalensis]|uniref:ogr/Delta-like zinc finger family protein n=1 Tax=Citrobacter portucalensis TaxID=1639133 RepID=UPI00226B1F20|nr:ogr/Delta-like zinc finger family protein [Citrobacter portucalensis]MCX9039107.1 ogr/Delta-like zinc finger family protein [Citrobacter portucalensis]
MMNCPLCSHASNTRSSYQVTSTTKERYCQCKNINCGCTFVTMETVVRQITMPSCASPVPPHPGVMQVKHSEQRPASAPHRLH